jgi:acetylornithine deacetylase
MPNQKTSSLDSRVMLERIQEAVDELKPKYVQTVKELVCIPSLLGFESHAQDYMEDLYRSCGLQVQKHTADIDNLRKHPGFMASASSDYGNRPNVIGQLRGSSNHRSLILNGHVDVVSAEPEKDWTRDPWGGEIEGDRLYGRGAGDMKAGLIANLYALKVLNRAGLQPQGSVMLQSVVDEEAGGCGGTLACLMAGYTADGLLITEPHNLNITISHAGIKYFRVKVTGRTAHAGLAHKGVNAIGKMYRIYHALEELDRIRGKRIHFPLYEKGSGRSCHLNIGKLTAGEWPSMVAGNAVLECRIGYVPGESSEEIAKLVESVIFKAADKDDWLRDHPPEIEWFGWDTDPWHQDPSHPFIEELTKATADVLGHPADLIGRAAGNDGRFSRYFQLPGACIGPTADNIHGIDENVSISSSLTLIKILSMFILKWCGVQPLGS